MNSIKGCGWLGCLALMIVLSGNLPSEVAVGQDAESSQEALALYSDAASFQNNGAFELAAEEWDKFVKKFPADPLAPKANHYLGVCQLQLKKFAPAAKAFDVVVTKYPKFEQVEDAYLNLGWCRYTLAGANNDKKLYAQASDAFQALSEKFPKGKFADQALFFWGESEYHQGNKKEAVAAYDKFVEGFPKSSLRDDGLYALGVTLEELGQYPKAGNAYDLFLKEFPDSDLATEVKMRKAETILQAGDFDTAQKILGEVAGVEGFPQVDHAIFRRAFCLSKQEKFDQAGELYANIADKYKESVYVDDARISAGRSFYRAGNDDAAAKWLKAVVDAGKQHVAEAAHWLSRVYLRDGKSEKVVPLVDGVLAKTADSEYFVNLKMDRADGFYSDPKTKEQSIAAYVAITTEHSDSPLASQALYNAAFAALELKKSADGLNYAERFLKEFPEDRLVPDVKYVAAECHLLAGDHADAESIYRELIDSNTEHPELEQWRVRLGLALFLQKKYADVVGLLEPLATNFKNKTVAAEVYYLVGASQYYLDEPAAAVSALEASLKADPKWRQSDEAMIFLSRAYRDEDKLDEAIKTISAMISQFPESQNLAHAHYRFGEYAYAKDDFKTAMAEYDAVLEADGDSPFAPYAKYGKGWSQLKTKAYPAAVESFTAVIADHGDHSLVADSQFARAMCNRQAGDFQAAIDDVTAFLKANPDSPQKSDALYERGLAEVALKKYADAATTFEALLDGDKKYPATDKVLYELGWAYKSQEGDENAGKAIAAFARLCKETPQSPLAAESHFHVAESRYAEGEYDEAATEYAAAKKSAGKGDLAEKSIYKLGWSNFQLKKYEPALAEFAEQLKQYPEGALNADALFMQGECLFRMENYEEAFPVFAKAKATPASSETIAVLTLLHGGQSASQLKKWDDAIAMLDEIPTKHAESPYLAEAYYELGWAKQNSGKADAGLKDYEQAATKSRGEVGARARFMIGEYYFGEKQYDEAIRQFLRVMFGFGGDNAVDEVKTWQAKAGFEAGRCAEVQIMGAKPDDRKMLIADAKKYYSYVVEKHADDALAAKSKQRVNELNKL